MKKVCNEKKMMYIICMIFSVLLIKSFHIINIPQIIILLITMVIPFFLEKEEIIAYVVCFSMLGTEIQTAFISASCIINLLFKNKFKIDLGIVLTIVLFTIRELLCIFNYQEDNVIELLRYLSVFFMVMYSLSMNISEKGRRLIIDSFIVSTTFSIVLVIIETLSLTGWNFNILFSGAIRLGYSEQLGGNLIFSADPNLIGQNCSLVISLSLSFILTKRLKAKYIIPIIICLLAGAMTLSKTFFLSLIIIFILSLFLSGEKRLKIDSIKKRILLLILAGFLVFSIYKIYPSYVNNLMNRVDSADVTNGRVRVATKYLNTISSNASDLLFGVGIQNVGLKTGIIASPHSSLVELIVCWGIVGTIYVCLYIFFLIRKNCCLNKNFKNMNLLALLIFLFVTQTTQLFRIRDHILCLIVIIVSCGVNLELEEKND